MGFTKLDSGIVDSSVWSEPLATRVVWVTILAKCNHGGFVPASRSGLLRACNVSESDFDIAIKKLESPDPDSRTIDNDGKRIKKVEGGWIVLNYLKYREFTYSDNPESIRKRKYRDIMGHLGTCPGMSRNVPECPENVRDISASASVSSSDTSIPPSEVLNNNINNNNLNGTSEMVNSNKPAETLQVDQKPPLAQPETPRAAPKRNNMAFEINGTKITWPYFQRIVNKCKGDRRAAELVFFRAYRASVKAQKINDKIFNAISWIEAGTKPDSGYAFLSITEESDNPRSVNAWIDRVIYKNKDQSVQTIKQVLTQTFGVGKDTS